MIRQLYRWFKSREVDQNVDTTHKATIIDGFRKGATFDDRVDTETEISHWASWILIVRAYMLIREVKGLFLAKFLLDFAPTIPLLFLGWFFNIIIDHVILGVPLIVEEVNFPPHMHWLLRILEGRDPIEIMFILSICFFVALLLIGMRAGGTGAGLYAGRDTASTAENAVSGGGSNQSGVWGSSSSWSMYV